MCFHFRRGSFFFFKGWFLFSRIFKVFFKKKHNFKKRDFPLPKKRLPFTSCFFFNKSVFFFQNFFLRKNSSCFFFFMKREWFLYRKKRFCFFFEVAGSFKRFLINKFFSCKNWRVFFKKWILIKG